MKTGFGKTDESQFWQFDDWPGRRQDILERFRTQVYGRNPVERPAEFSFDVRDAGTPAMGGRALRRQVSLKFGGPGGRGEIRVVAFAPTSVRPAPAVLFICNRERQLIDPERRIQSGFWPAEDIVDHGYAAVAFHYEDVEPDNPGATGRGVRSIFPDEGAPGSRWGAIAAWAWGASRVCDWLEEEDWVDRGRIAIAGHSRGGKAALWVGANDARFTLVFSNNSGCSGAKLHRMTLAGAETIEQINTAFPHWFCETFKSYGGRDGDLPFDQHELLALIAPRLAYVASASSDHHAGPPGEFEACRLSAAAWNLHGRQGLQDAAFPQPGESLHDGSPGYHLRNGIHDLTAWDWKLFLDYADIWWRPTNDTGGPPPNPR